MKPLRCIYHLLFLRCLVFFSACLSRLWKTISNLSRRTRLHALAVVHNGATSAPFPSPRECLRADRGAREPIAFLCTQLRACALSGALVLYSEARSALARADVTSLFRAAREIKMSKRGKQQKESRKGPTRRERGRGWRKGGERRRRRQKK